MTVRLKYAQNAIDGDGTLLRGGLYQVGMNDLLGGNSGHRIWESGTAKNYSIGARFVTADGRVFRYAKAGNATHPLIPGQGCQGYSPLILEYNTIAETAAALATSVVVHVSVVSGALADGVIAADELEGGYIVIFDKTATNMVVHRLILGNTAVQGVGITGGGTAHMTVRLDDPIPNALIAATDAAAIIASPYSDVRGAWGGSASIVGVPTMVGAEGEYLWIQTWGPCWVAGHAEVTATAYSRQVIFNGDGSLGDHNYNDTDSNKQQHAGFVLQRTAGNSETFIMLQISI